ncbi:NOP5 N-terminal, partial [Trinorchestia longiramus]
MLKEKALKDVDNIPQYFASAESASQIVQLAGFHKFQNSAEALAAAVAINEGKALKPLRSVLKKALKNEVHKKLLVLDAKLGSSIKNKLPDLEIVCNSSVTELIRCIRGQMESLIPGISDNEASAMMLGLGHNLARYKLKFSPDKVDTMVVQAVNLLDDLDKELNNYVMRLKEWYGWHFPELAKILIENTAYVHTVKKMGVRTNASTTDFSAILDEELAERVKEAAEVSMGCQITEDDILFMQELADQIIDLTSYRGHLSDYLTRRMTCLAPNLTIMLGELIGARLIAHSGSLINLAKNASSTLQLIGAEKALFRALKTKKATPKYGLIYHAELVNRAPNECK